MSIQYLQLQRTCKELRCSSSELKPGLDSYLGERELLRITFNMDKRLSLSSSLLNTSYWRRSFREEICFKWTLHSSPPLPFPCSPLSLSVIHKRVQPGEYRDAHFNLESMNKQWGFHVLQKFPLAAFTHTLYSRYDARVELTLAQWGTRGVCGTDSYTDIWSRKQWCDVRDLCTHTSTHSISNH